MLPIPALWYLDTSVIYPNESNESNLLWYPHILYSNNICEILLYNRQLVITNELIYIVWAAHNSGKIIVKQDYFPTVPVKKYMDNFIDDLSWEGSSYFIWDTPRHESYISLINM